MTDPSLMLAAILVPVLGAFALPIVGVEHKRLRNGISAALVFATLLCNLLLLPTVLWEGTAVESNLVGFPLHADGFAAFVATSSSLISLVIVLYSFDYIEGHRGEGELDHSSEYYFLVLLFLGSMMGIVYAANLLLLYAFWELTAVASWRLIGYFRKPLDVRRANKAFLTTVFGALLMFVGFVMLWEQTGSFDLAVIRQKLGSEVVPDVALVCILAGIFAKSATMPFHTWLPDAGVAPSPVTSLLHAAVLVKIGVYVFARLFVANFGISAFGHRLVLIVAATSAIVSAAAALVDTDLKRIIAYSTISQLGFIFLGFAAGTHLAVTGALLYVLMHGIAKGGLFLCAGIVEHNLHTTNITQMGGLRKTMPITATTFLLCALSVMGVPPLGGFFSKSMLIIGAVEGGYPWITTVFVVGAVFTMLYLFRVYDQVFLGEPRGHQPPEGSRTMVYAVASLAVMSIVGGIAIHWPGMLAEAAVDQILEVAK
ncbi:MAG: NADH-quinone oxidoreductase subunit L [Polyangiaceae bacterium]